MGLDIVAVGRLEGKWELGVWVDKLADSVGKRVVEVGRGES